MLENILLVSQVINNAVFATSFWQVFNIALHVHNCELVSRPTGKLSKLSFQTNFYEKASITVRTANSNKAPTNFSDVILKHLTQLLIKLKRFCLKGELIIFDTSYYLLEDFIRIRCYIIDALLRNIIICHWYWLRGGFSHFSLALWELFSDAHWFYIEYIELLHSVNILIDSRF